MQEQNYCPPITIQDVVQQITETNREHVYWDRRFSGKTQLAYRRTSISREKDFFSEEVIDEQFALCLLAAVLQFPIFYLERSPGEVGQGPIFSFMQQRTSEADITLFKFRKDKLSARMSDEMQKFFESDNNNSRNR